MDPVASVSVVRVVDVDVTVSAGDFGDLIPLFDPSGYVANSATSSPLTAGGCVSDCLVVTVAALLTDGRRGDFGARARMEDPSG